MPVNQIMDAVETRVVTWSEKPEEPLGPARQAPARARPERRARVRRREAGPRLVSSDEMRDALLRWGDADEQP